jgi:hypothetical protein
MMDRRRINRGRLNFGKTGLAMVSAAAWTKGAISTLTPPKVATTNETASILFVTVVDYSSRISSPFATRAEQRPQYSHIKVIRQTVTLRG